MEEEAPMLKTAAILPVPRKGAAMKGGVGPYLMGPSGLDFQDDK
jgi:hypothetical protein